MKHLPSWIAVLLGVLVCHDIAQAEGSWRRHRAIDYQALALADQARADQSDRDATQALPAQDTDSLPPTAAGGRMSVTLAQPPRRLTTAGPAPVAPPMDTEPRFDLAVNNAPAAQVFLQLGMGTNYTVVVPPELSGQVTLSLKGTTVMEALQVLRDQYGYDYRITGKRVVVYPNTIQTRVFSINYLPGRREGSSDLRVKSSSINVSNGGGTGGGSGGSGGKSASGGSSGENDDDTSHVRMSSVSDFWGEIKASLVSMIGTGNGRGVVMNPGSGLIVVRATPAEHRSVAEFLKAVQVTIERQVMLEAKIIEVSLSNDAQTGVNWSLFGTRGSSGVGVVNMAPGVTLKSNQLQTEDLAITSGPSFASAGRGFYGLAIQASNFNALINFLQTQGDVQVLSSPRIATMNNQKAVLKVGRDEMFVTGVTTSATQVGDQTVFTPKLDLQSLFSGISLDVMPQIDEDGVVMLHVHPAISDVKEKQKVVDLGSLGVYKLPLAASSINETDSIVRVKDGSIVAIGGLMRQSVAIDKNGLPILGDAPVVGSLFSQKSAVSSKRELVILIKPTVITEDGSGWSSESPATPLLKPER